MVYKAFYFAILVCTFLFAMTNDRKAKALENFLYVLLAGGMFYISAFRHDVGYDFTSYKNIFNMVHNSANSIWYLYKNEDMDIGYIFLNKICANFEILIFVVACAAIIPKLIYIYKEDNNKLAALLMYYCGIFMTYDMGVIRQGLSIGIALFGIKYIENRNPFRFSLVIFVAALFHPSALVYIPLYLLGDKELSKKTYYITGLIALVFSVFSDNSFLLYLAQHLPKGIISNKLAYYTLYTTESLTLSLIKRYIFLIVFVEFIKRMEIKKSDNKQVIYLNSYYLSILFASLFASIPIIGGRGNAGLYFVQVFLFSKMLSMIKSGLIKIMLVILIAVLFYQTLMGPISDIYGTYLPYKTIFD